MSKCQRHTTSYFVKLPRCIEQQKIHLEARFCMHLKTALETLHSENLSAENPCRKTDFPVGRRQPAPLGLSENGFSSCWYAQLWKNIGVALRSLRMSTEQCEVESLGRKFSGSCRKTSVFKQCSFGLNSEF